MRVLLLVMIACGSSKPAPQQASGPVATGGSGSGSAAPTTDTGVRCDNVQASCKVVDECDEIADVSDDQLSQDEQACGQHGTWQRAACDITNATGGCQMIWEQAGCEVIWYFDRGDEKARRDTCASNNGKWIAR